MLLSFARYSVVLIRSGSMSSNSNLHFLSFSVGFRSRKPMNRFCLKFQQTEPVKACCYLNKTSCHTCVALNIVTMYSSTAAYVIELQYESGYITRVCVSTEYGPHLINLLCFQTIINLQCIY
jgi:hypothetical protein